MTNKTFLNAFLCAVGVALSACQSGPIGPESVDSRQFQDVVVPAGFRLLDRAHESFSREEATWRQGHFVYSGSSRVDDAAAYVQLRMPQHNWAMVEEQALEDAGKRLRFERGIYSADYTFHRADGQTRMVVDYATDYSRR